MVVGTGDERRGAIAIADPAGTVRLGLLGAPQSGRVRICTGDGSSIRTADGRGFMRIAGSSLSPGIRLGNATAESGIRLGYPDDSNREPIVELYGPGMVKRVRIETGQDHGKVWVWGPGERWGNVVRPFRN